VILSAISVRVLAAVWVEAVLVGVDAFDNLAAYGR
jgi:hypothetical protein